MKTYLFCQGDGNEGNFKRFLVDLEDNHSPWAALRALVLNGYIPGHKVRRYIAANIEIDGERDNVDAIVFEGPKGETAFDAAWLTAELQLQSDDDTAYEIDFGMRRCPLRESLDRGAWRVFTKHNRS